jgi:hypothetical protein
MSTPIDVTTHQRFLGIVLIASSLLVGVAGLFHPILAGEGSEQLAAVAATGEWRVIHWCIAFGCVVAVAGLAGVSSIHAASPGEGAARIGASLAILGYAVSLVGVLFMLGAASELAQAHRQPAAPGDPEDAVFLYDMLHPYVLAALRIGAFAVSLGIASLGWAVTIGRLWRVWIGWLGLGAGAVGALADVVLSERSPAIVAGIGLAAVWQLVTGLTLTSRSAARPSEPVGSS